MASGHSVQLSRCQRHRPPGAATLPPTWAAPRDGGDRVALRLSWACHMLTKHLTTGCPGVPGQRQDWAARSGGTLPLGLDERVPASGEGDRDLHGDAERDKDSPASSCVRASQRGQNYRSWKQSLLHTQLPATLTRKGKRT